MKKLIILALAMVLTTGVVMAKGHGRSGGAGFGGAAMSGDCPGKGMRGMRGGMGAGMADFEPVTADQAKVKAEEYVTANLKGYELGASEEIDGRRFKVYKFDAKDAAGNNFVLVVTPRGFVKGPFINNQ